MDFFGSTPFYQMFYGSFYLLHLDCKFKRAKDADALDAICKEYQSRAMSKGKKPSVLAQLNQFKELVASLPKKLRVKQQERDL